MAHNRLRRLQRLQAGQPQASQEPADRGGLRPTTAAIRRTGMRSRLQFHRGNAFDQQRATFECQSGILMTVSSGGILGDSEA